MFWAIAAGLVDLGFAAFHLMFARLFDWPASLAYAGPLNSAITRTLNWVLVYVFLVYGGALIWFAIENGSAPSLLAAAGAGFWILRTLLQPMLFQMNNTPSLAFTGVLIAAVVLHLAASVL
jgi:hypothetical protein